MNRLLVPLRALFAAQALHTPVALDCPPAGSNGMLRTDRLLQVEQVHQGRAPDRERITAHYLALDLLPTATMSSRPQGPQLAPATFTHVAHLPVARFARGMRCQGETASRDRTTKCQQLANGRIILPCRGFHTAGAYVPPKKNRCMASHLWVFARGLRPRVTRATSGRPRITILLSSPPCWHASLVRIL